MTPEQFVEKVGNNKLPITPAGEYLPEDFEMTAEERERFDAWVASGMRTVGDPRGGATL